MMKRLLVILPVFLLFAANFMSSCSDPEPPKAVVTVVTVDPQGETWPEANCEVYIDIPDGASQPELIEYAEKSKLTDTYGQVEYDFKYEGILTVIAKKGDGAESCGRGVLILKEDEVYHEEIRLTGCEDI